MLENDLKQGRGNYNKFREEISYNLVMSKINSSLGFGVFQFVKNGKEPYFVKKIYSNNVNKISGLILISEEIHQVSEGFFLIECTLLVNYLAVAIFVCL